MFTGIVQGCGQITHVEWASQGGSLCHYRLCIKKELCTGLELGASLAINGVCQTLTAHNPLTSELSFSAVAQTLAVTTLRDLRVGDYVNVERACALGQEVGGHMVSGHVYGRVRLEDWSSGDVLTFSAPAGEGLYVIPRGFVAIDGVSLTLMDVEQQRSSLPKRFRISLIPYTRNHTIFQYKQLGDDCNIEFDPITYTIMYIHSHLRT